MPVWRLTETYEYRKKFEADELGAGTEAHARIFPGLMDEIYLWKIFGKKFERAVELKVIVKEK